MPHKKAYVSPRKRVPDVTQPDFQPRDAFPVPPRVKSHPYIPPVAPQPDYDRPKAAAKKSRGETPLSRLLKFRQGEYTKDANGKNKKR